MKMTINDDGEDDENRSNDDDIILMTLTRTMTLNQRLTTRRK